MILVTYKTAKLMHTPAGGVASRRECGRSGAKQRLYYWAGRQRLREITKLEGTSAFINMDW
jgi:hypothetical protein